MAAEKYLRQRIADAIKVKLEAIKRPDYHFKPTLITSAPEDLPTTPTSPLTLYVKIGKEEIRQDLAAGIDHCTLEVGIVVAETDYTDADERHTEHAGDVRKAMGTGISVTDSNSVTLPLSVWARGVDVWSAFGQLVTEIFFDVEYDCPSAQPGVF